MRNNVVVLAYGTILTDTFCNIKAPVRVRLTRYCVCYVIVKDVAFLTGKYSLIIKLCSTSTDNSLVYGNRWTAYLYKTNNDYVNMWEHNYELDCYTRKRFAQ